MAGFTPGPVGPRPRARDLGGLVTEKEEQRKKKMAMIFTQNAIKMVQLRGLHPLYPTSWALPMDPSGPLVGSCTKAVRLACIEHIHFDNGDGDTEFQPGLGP